MENIVLLLLMLSVTCEAQQTSRNYNKDTSTLSARELALEEHIDFLMERLNEMHAKQKKVIEDQIAQGEKIQALEEQNQAQEEKIQAQEEKIQAQDNNIEQYKTSQAQATFYAQGLRSGYDSNAYSAGDRLVYQTPIINSGEHYNKNTGEYTCPTSGVYMFVYSVHGVNIKQGPSHSIVTASLYREGDRVSRVYYRNHNNEITDVSLSNSGLVTCQAGQKVWIEGDYDNNFIGGSPFVNVFGGVLLYTT